MTEVSVLLKVFPVFESHFPTAALSLPISHTSLVLSLLMLSLLLSLSVSCRLSRTRSFSHSDSQALPVFL